MKTSIKLLLITTMTLMLTACNSKTTEEESNATNAQNPTTQTTEDTSANDGADAVVSGTNAGTVGSTTTSNNGGTTTSNDGSNSASPENTINSSDDNSTTGDNDANTSTSNETNNTTVTPTLDITSLNLTINKTTLNKDETTTVKVEATYSDNIRKEVTDKVEWVVTPSDAVKVSNVTLTALKDKATTVKAKLANKTSESVNLNITWIVDGHLLPPEPDPAVNNSTLLGIDSNNNGVRDDVERWIYDRYKDEHPIMIPLKMQEARAFRYIIQDPSQAKKRDKAYIDASNCSNAFGSWANAFGRKPLFDKESEIVIKELRENIQFNTTERARAYGLYNQNLSGMVFEDEWPSEKWIENCDFNTTKYIEMSEKL